MAGRNIYIIGHKNPDTDSISASLSYAYLKNKLNDTDRFIPCRAGFVSDETKFVLDYLGIETPLLFDDARTQIMDIDIRDNPGVNPETSLRDAWKLLKERNVLTLPITEQEKLIGVLTIKDLGKVYIDNTSVDLLSTAKTTYRSIVKVLNGELLVDNGKERLQKGRVAIGAAGVEFISEFVEEGDVFIVSNRDGTHSAAIESGAGCLIVGLGAYVTDETIELAREKGCSIITTDYDTYTIARLINQSIPVRYAMRGESLVTFKPEDYMDYIKKAMRKYTYRDFPVIGDDGKYLGMISRRFVLDSKKKQIILVDHNEKAQAIDGVEEAEILEIIDHHRLGNIETFNPVYFRNQPLGSSSTIIYQMATERGLEFDEKYSGLLCAGIISDTLLFTSPTTTEVDIEIAHKLAEKAKINIQEFAEKMFRAGSPTDEEPEIMIQRDFKKYNVNNIAFGIGQINFINGDNISGIKEKITPHLEAVKKEHALDVIFVLLTNISASSSIVVFAGEDAEQAVEDAFRKECENSSALLEGIVSRKKQFVPQIMLALQN